MPRNLHRLSPGAYRLLLSLDLFESFEDHVVDYQVDTALKHRYEVFIWAVLGILEFTFLVKQMGKWPHGEVAAYSVWRADVFCDVSQVRGVSMVYIG